MILHPCAYPGCGKDIPITDKYCKKHRNADKARRQESERFHRKGEKRLYNSRAWKNLRAAHLRHFPLCAECLKRGIVTAATDVDHIIPHRGDPSLMWNPNNLQSLCHACHSRKTAAEDGGFGNKISEPGRRVESQK